MLALSGFRQISELGIRSPAFLNVIDGSTVELSSLLSALLPAILSILVSTFVMIGQLLSLVSKPSHWQYINKTLTKGVWVCLSHIYGKHILFLTFLSSDFLGRPSKKNNICYPRGGQDQSLLHFSKACLKCI